MLKKKPKSVNPLGLLNDMDEIKPVLFRDSQLKAVRKLDCKRYTIRNKKTTLPGPLFRSCIIYP